VVADRLYRSRDDRVIAGVSGGIARALDADPSVIRIAWVIVAVLSGGLAVLVYIVMAVVVPEAPEGEDLTPAPTGPTGPVAEGSWVAPDGSIVPRAADAAPGTSAPRKDPTDTRRIALLGGLVLVAIGAIFLAREFLPAIDFSATWPYVSVGLGIVLVILSIRPRRG
jgi:phage shock protein PspC (stress-responsive transcriptional regulator)